VSFRENLEGQSDLSAIVPVAAKKYASLLNWEAQTGIGRSGSKHGKGEHSQYASTFFVIQARKPAVILKQGTLQIRCMKKHQRKLS
jgi:hypothetical protein